MDERWAGTIEERISHLPSHRELASVKEANHLEIEKLRITIERLLEKHEVSTRDLIRDEVTKTVEAAFTLQRQQLEMYINSKFPPAAKRDWLPIALMMVVAAIVGGTEAIPALLKFF